MKGKLSKLLVGLFALAGVFFVYIFYNCGFLSLNINDETKAATSFTYPAKAGDQLIVLNTPYFVSSNDIERSWCRK